MNSMNISCPYCGKIHDRKFICDKKAQAEKERAEKNSIYKKYSATTKWRRQNKWDKKAIQIKKRDKYLCQCCKNNICMEEGRQYNSDNLSVHHIVPLVEDYGLGLDDSNLITLCDRHHEMAEAGDISRDVLRSLINNDDDDDYILLW